MASVRSKGKCEFCKTEYTKAGMAKHLVSCPARQAGATTLDEKDRKKAQQAQLFHLQVEDRDSPLYWLHIEMPIEATLSDLDNFLRGKWLECCGHLSAFNINGSSYASASGLGDKLMRGVKLNRVLGVGQQFEHEYDFGTTTELKLKVVREHEGLAVKGQAIQILAQNEPPQFPCDTCGKLATQICLECASDGESAGWLCDECVEAHKCDEEMLMPVVNSPRVGVCGYTG